MAGDGGEDARRVEAVGAMYAKYKKGHFADVEDVSAEEAMEMAAAHDAVVFVDTRSEQEMQVSTIPNAVARPKPVPSPTGFVVKKGSKTRAFTSSDIPQPLSVTFNSA